MLHLSASHPRARIKNFDGTPYSVEPHADFALGRFFLSKRIHCVLTQLSKDIPIMVIAIDDVPNSLPKALVSLLIEDVNSCNLRFDCVHGLRH